MYFCMEKKAAFNELICNIYIAEAFADRVDRGCFHYLS